MNTRVTESCPLCGGERGNGEITFSAELGEGVLVVRHVPATVCFQCGANWLSDEVAEQLEARAQEARRRHAEVEVVAYS